MTGTQGIEPSLASKGNYFAGPVGRGERLSRSACHHCALGDVSVKIPTAESDIAIIESGVRQLGFLAFANVQDGAPWHLEVFRCLFQGERTFE